MKLFADLIEYFNSSSQEILSLLVEHIELTVLALVAAILIGVPLGILIAYIRPASKPVLAFANVVQADRIYVLDQGTVVESGSHTALLEQHGRYETLWTAQQNLENYGKDGEPA